MERPSPLASIRTLFDVLGLPRDASAHQIEVAWHQHVVDAEGRYDRVPEELRAAYSVLRNATNREIYRDLLRCCETGSLVTQPPDKVTKFTNFCKQCGLTLYPVPKLPNTYAVRAPWQDPPNWAEQRPPPLSRLAVALDYVIRKLLFFGVFRGKRWFQRCGLVLAYAVVLALLGAAGLKASGWWDRLQRNWELAARRAFERDVRDQHRELTGKLDELKRASAALSSDFRAVAGITLEEASQGPGAWPDDLARVVRSNGSVADALSALLRARAKPDEFRAIEDELKQADAATQRGDYDAVDPAHLRQLCAQISSRAELLKAQHCKVDDIRVILAADRFEHATSAPGRSEP